MSAVQGFFTLNEGLAQWEKRTAVVAVVHVVKS